MKKYKIEKLQDEKVKELKAALHTFFAKVKPEYLQELSSLVGRKLEDKKDTEDYNLDLVSNLVDKTAQMFMEAGQETITEGDVLSVTEKIANLENADDKIEDLVMALADGEYDKFPFSMEIVQELRAKFLLKTEQSDTYKSLMKEVDSLITQYLSKKEWEKIKTAMKDAEKRIFEEDIDFINPPEGMNQGDVIPLTPEEASLYGIMTDVAVDKRKDNHDMLSLKELVLILKGADVDHLTIGPGFFLKYLPELREQDIHGIVFHVENNKLKSIKTVKIFEEHMTTYSPITAAIALVDSNGSDTEMKDKIIGKGKKQKVSKRYTFTKLYEPKDVVKDKDRYYVCVDGVVAAPEKMTPLGYEKPSYNTKRVASGETFLFERQEGELICTRLYFMPYKMSEINPLLQTGSVVFGSNDQSLHSCVKDPRSFGWNVEDEYKKRWGENKDERFSEVATAAKVENYISENPEEIFMGGSHPETEAQWARNKVLANACLSVLEVSDFTMDFFLRTLSDAQAKYGFMHPHLRKFLENYAPLTKRFLVKKYVDSSNGLTVEYQPTFYKRLGKKLKANLGAKLLADMNKWEEVGKLVEDGMSYKDAVKKVYPEDEAKEKLKNLK